MQRNRTSGLFWSIVGLLTLACAASAVAQAGAYVGVIDGNERCAVVLTQPGSTAGLTVTLTPLGADECNRTTILTGRLSPGANPTGGSFSGTIYRCTTKELEDKCRALGRPIGENFSKPASGTFNNSPQGLRLEITYTAEKWLKEDCKFQKTDKGSVVVLIASTSRSGSGPSTFDDLIRSVLYNPPGHPLNPANR